jgi:hypothetical protein
MAIADPLRAVVAIGCDRRLLQKSGFYDWWFLPLFAKFDEIFAKMLCRPFKIGL